VGTTVVAHVLATAVELNESAACRAVVVTVLTETAMTWWERLGFHRFDATDSLDSYLLTSEIVETLHRLGRA
jgi:N-acetylglutamate synthase-like GNAT family acetyltransferase